MEIPTKPGQALDILKAGVLLPSLFPRIREKAKDDRGMRLLDVGAGLSELTIALIDDLHELGMPIELLGLVDIDAAAIAHSILAVRNAYWDTLFFKDDVWPLQEVAYRVHCEEESIQFDVAEFVMSCVR